MREEFADFYGRLLTADQVPAGLEDLVQALPSVKSGKYGLVCGRCASPIESDWQLPAGDVYCRACIVFGRVRSSQSLYHLPQEPFESGHFLQWSGSLTPYQAQVSQGLLTALDKGENILVHAVTGAGKTEMIYASLDKVLSTGQSVALVSPRIDVCLELHRRLSQDFSCPISLLHGDSQPYQRSPLLISTVHQLFKFYQAFDLIIIDEVDAFPFVDNAQLYQAVSNALKPQGQSFFLTATSTDNLDRQVRSGKLRKLDLARRFHANPLVVPKPVWLSGLLEQMTKGKLPPKLKRDIKNQRQTGFPLLIFFPHIALGQEFARILAQFFPEEQVGFVSSQTEDRLDQVQAFREGRLTILVATTILERGVTFPGVDVMVLWANHALYTRSALVQIAGRVGRSSDRPTGLLNFYQDGRTKAMAQAIREIKEMNKKGGFA